MSRDIDILTELQAMASPLAGLPCQMPFALPEEYFRSLVDSLVSGTLAAERNDISNAGLPQTVPLVVPDAYLSTLAENLAQAAVSSDARIVPYDVPQNYFETLPNELLSVAKTTKTSTRRTKIINLSPQLGRIARLAAAALLVLGLSFGGYQYMHPPSADKIAANQLSKLDNEVVNAYVSQHVDDFDAENLEKAVANTGTDLEGAINMLDAAEIRDYLQDSETL